MRAWSPRSQLAGHSCCGDHLTRTRGDGQFEPALKAAEERLTRHVDNEIAKLREELEYTQAQILALSEQAGTPSVRSKGRGL